MRTKQNKKWALLLSTNYITTKQTWVNYTLSDNLSKYEELIFIPGWYSNPYPTVHIPVDLFKVTTTRNRLLMNASGNTIQCYYKNNTTVTVYDSIGTYDTLRIYGR